MRTDQIAVRFPHELLADLDDLVARGVYPSRAAAVRAGVRVLAELQRRKETDDVIVDAYRRVPPGQADLDAAIVSLRAAILEEPW